MKIIIIVAMTPERLIGREGRLPWHEPEDLRHFKRTTMGHAVIMGRKTFESIGKALPSRRNIVVTRDRGLVGKISGGSMTHPTGLDVVHSLDDAIELCRQRGEDKAFIIGGAQIYEQALPIADEMIVTIIDRQGLAGDTYFPDWNPADWEASEIAKGTPLRIIKYRRKR